MKNGMGRQILWYGFLNVLNKVINVFFKTLRLMCYLVGLVIFIALLPIIYTRYKYGKTQKNGFDHPNMLIFYWKMIVDKLFINVIF
jgi:hypothetical protein